MIPSRTARTSVGVALAAAVGAMLTAATARGAVGDLLVTGYLSGTVHWYNGPTVDLSADCLGVFARPVGPYGLAIGPDFNLYVSCPSGTGGGNGVLRFDGRSGTQLGTFVPYGEGGLIDPKGIAFGPDGSLYVCSSGTDEVKVYDGQTGMHLADLTCAGMDHPNDLAFDPNQPSMLYVVDGGWAPHDAGVTRFNVATGSCEIFAGHGEAAYEGISFGEDGNLYILSYEERSVLVVDPATGTYIRECIPGTAHGPLRGKPAFGPDGNLYLCETGTNRVLCYDPTTGAFLHVAATACHLAGPVYCIFDVGIHTGDLLVSGSWSDAIHRFRGPALGVPGACAGAFATVGSPLSFTFGPDLDLYVASPRPGPSAILRFDGKTGEPKEVFVPGGSAGLYDPKGIAFGPDGNLYVCSSGTDEVKVYDGRTGVHIVNLTCADMEHPSDLAFGPDEPTRLYVVDGGSNPNDAGITCFNLATGSCESFAAHGEVAYDGISFGKDGYIYVLSYNDKSVLVFDPATGEYVRECIPGTGHGTLRGKPLFGPDGNLYINDVDGSCVRRYDPRTCEPVESVFASGCALNAPMSCRFVPVVHRGDLNCDGTVDFADINPFVLALTNWTQWWLQHQECRWENADVSGDGEVTFGDINPFVKLLTD